jgi:hypothetical protein
MKIILALLTFILFPVLCNADCTPKAEAAKIFMNEYKAHCDDVMNRKSKLTDVQWVQKSTRITDAFKMAYKRLVSNANKKEPESGLGSDPIFDAQDYPDKGLKVLTCDDRSNFVTLKGVDWDDFRVVVKVIKTDKGWLVDGAGVINIPKKNRAARD